MQLRGYFGGYEKPITVGIVVNQNKIEAVSVLVFRESRGAEVRYPFFTVQFLDGQLNEQFKLDKTIDGISGATLSVQALKKVVTLALYLHQQTPFSQSK